MQNIKLLTLCIVQKEGRVLLGMKKRGFGEGRWNGFGGKVEPSETILGAARREMLEEAGVEPVGLEKVGILHFEFDGDPVLLEGHVVRGNDVSGLPKESEEMSPKWFSIDEIPFNEMWPDDIHWFPLFLSGKKFRGRFTFGKGDSIVEQVLGEVSTIA